jgi:hypothetical protein
MPTLLINVGYREKSRSNAGIAEPSLLTLSRSRLSSITEDIDHSSWAYWDASTSLGFHFVASRRGVTSHDQVALHGI